MTRLPATFLDVGNYDMGHVWESMIHCDVVFPPEVDLTRLRQALDLCLMAQPVLRARFVDGAFTPHWSVEPASSETVVPWAALRHPSPKGSVDETDSVADFLQQRLDPFSSPQIHAASLTTAKGIRVILKVNHMVADGGGCKDLLRLWATLYSELERNPGFVPPENRASRGGMQVFRRFPLRTILASGRNHFRSLRREQSMGPVVELPASWDGAGAWKYVTHELGPDCMIGGQRLCQEADCTWNDLLVTAWARVLPRLAGSPATRQLRVTGTVDLRRHLPNRRAKAICNLSAFLSLELGPPVEEPFLATLKRVTDQTRALKAGPLGLDSLVGLSIPVGLMPHFLRRKLVRWLFPRMKREGKVAPGLTNIGAIPEDALGFGPHTPLKAAILSPPSVPPFFFAAASGYRQAITLTAATSPVSIPPSVVRRLFEGMEDEITCHTVNTPDPT